MREESHCFVLRAKYRSTLFAIGIDNRRQHYLRTQRHSEPFQRRRRWTLLRIEDLAAMPLRKPRPMIQFLVRKPKLGFPRSENRCPIRPCSDQVHGRQLFRRKAARISAPPNPLIKFRILGIKAAKCGGNRPRKTAITSIIRHAVRFGGTPAPTPGLLRAPIGELAFSIASASVAPSAWPSRAQAFLTSSVGTSRIAR